MARPKADLPDRVALRALVVDDELLLRVTPAARSEGIAIAGDRLAVRTRAKPQDGAANKAVEKLVAGALGVALLLASGDCGTPFNKVTFPI